MLYTKQREEIASLKNSLRKLQSQLDSLKLPVVQTQFCGVQTDDLHRAIPLEAAAGESAQIPLSSKVVVDNTPASESSNLLTTKLPTPAPTSRDFAISESVIDKWKRRSSDVGLALAPELRQSVEAASQQLAANAMLRPEIAAGESMATKWKLKATAGGGTFVLAGKDDTARRQSLGPGQIGNGGGRGNAERRKSLQHLVLGGQAGSTKALLVARARSDGGGRTFEKPTGEDDEPPFDPSSVLRGSDGESGDKKYSF
jgi:hypothetical protein